MASKAELENKKTIARTLFMQGNQQKEISEKIGVSEATVSKWAKQECWAEQRAAKNIDRQTLVNKCLASLDKIIEAFNKNMEQQEEVDVAQFTKLSDVIVKTSAAIERLDRKNGIVDIINVFTAFLNWLKIRMTIDSEVTPELLKLIAKYQDLFITEKLSSNQE